MTRAGRLALVLTGLAGVPHTARAQLLRADVLVTAARVTTVLGGGPPRLSGPLIGGEGEFGRGVIGVRGSYGQGTLTASDGTSWDEVDGDVAVVARPTPWLRLAFGPSARSYVTSGATVRWIVWQLHAGLSIPLASDRVRATFDGWHSLAGSLNAGGSFHAAGGVSGGMRVWIPRSPVQAVVRYRVERLLLTGSGAETFDGLTVGAGVALW